MWYSSMNSSQIVRSDSHVLPVQLRPCISGTRSTVFCRLLFCPGKCSPLNMTISLGLHPCPSSQSKTVHCWSNTMVGSSARPRSLKLAAQASTSIPLLRFTFVSLSEVCWWEFQIQLKSQICCLHNLCD